MPWREVSIVDERREFVAGNAGRSEGRELCRRLGIHPDTVTSGLVAGRGRAFGSLAAAAFEPDADRGGERRRAFWRYATLTCLGRSQDRPLSQREERDCPAHSTVHEILRRHGRIVAAPGGSAAQHRFEKPAPNLLWQMDFKGHMPLANGGRCHPLTIVDDHSRYAVGLEACANEQAGTVQSRLEQTFRRYGMPDAFFVDNGTPWGDSSGQRWTRLGVWLLKLGIDVLHSRPYHPQSRGKSERFHRTLKAEVFALRRFRDLAEFQRAFDRWRTIYNLDRPHQALDQQVPASRYGPSNRAMPEHLPQVEYDDGEIVRRVGTTKAYVSFKGRLWKVPEAFCGESLAIRPRAAEGQYGVFFGAYEIANIDLTQHKSVGDVSEQVSIMSPG